MIEDREQKLYNGYSPCSEGTGETVVTLGDVINNNPNSYPYDLNQEGFYLSQQYFLAWYYGTEAYNRLDPQTMSHNSYLVYKFNSMRKDGVDLSKLTVDEVDQMAFDNASLWFKIDTAVLATYIAYNAYLMYKTSYVKSSPFEIPSDAKVVKQVKNGYEQIKYNWSDGTYKYEARWHTRTPGAPADQGNTWVITRTTPGSPTGQMKVQHILTGENQWTPMSEWQAAVSARQNGTATAAQQALLDSGHWPAE